MGELIEREALLEKSIKAYCNDGGTKTTVMIIKRDDVVSAPAIAAAPVKRGKWEKRTYWIGSFGENQMVCSECGKKYGFHAPYNYCPNCGAKMDGVEK